MKLPIKFKYFTIDAGLVPARTSEELPIDGYLMTDKLGCVVASGTSLAGLIGHAQQADIQHEVQAQFVARRLPTLVHLDGIDIDAPAERSSGILVPPHVAGGGTPGGGGPISH